MSQKSEAFRPLDEVRSEITPYTYFAEEADRTAMVAAMGAELHIMEGGVPGGGKTTIAKAFARSIDVSMGRFQGDPHATTKSLLGHRLFDQASGTYSFIPGPIFNHILLADEINRSTPETHAALMEGMEEGQVTTTDGVTRPLPAFFRVMATANFADNKEGTMPLPAANLDRFGFFIDMSEPYTEADMEVIDQVADRWAETGGPSSVVNEDEMLMAQRAIRAIKRNADRDRIRHAQYLVRSVREHPAVDQAESVLAKARPSLQMLMLASGLCAMRGQVTLEEVDINRAAPYVLAHRTVISRREARQYNTKPMDVINEVLSRVA